MELRVMAGSRTIKCTHQLHLLLLAAAVALSSWACAPTAAPASNGPPAASPLTRTTKTIVAAVGVPITGFSAIGLPGNGNTIALFFDVHSNGLVTSDDQGRPIPRLASELPALDKGTLRLLDDGRMTTEYHLRPDATWHDGTPFTAHDVAFGFRAHADPELAFSDRSAVAQIESVEEIDTHSVLITWKHPFYLADSLGALILFPLPVHILEQPYNTLDKQSFLQLRYWTTEYVHTGPFRLVRFEPGQGATFEAYDGYFLGRPMVDAFEVREILDTNARYAAILSGDVDLTLDGLNGAQAASLEGQWQSTDGGRVMFTQGPVYFFAFQFASEYA